MVHKEKIGHHKIEALEFQQILFRKLKKKVTDWEKNFANNMLDKHLVSITSKEPF